MLEKRPRLVDPGYLAWLRTQSCVCGCHQGPPCDAAHIRAASLKHDKPHTGGWRKPDDKWALPLKHSHHMAQHAHGDELGWWSAHGIDPFELAIKYYKRYGGDGGKPRVRRKTIKPRLPKEQRARIQSRPFPKQQRQLRSRPQ